MAYKYYFKSLAEVRQNLINSIHETMPEADLSEGKFLTNVFVNPVADEFSALYGDMQLLKQSQSILFATDEDLDILAANYFTYRKQATKAIGKVRFYIINSGTIQNTVTETGIPEVVSIPIGTTLSTTATYLNAAVTVETTELLYATKSNIMSLPIDNETGYRYLECYARATIAGEAGNIAANTLTQLSGDIQGVAFATNPFAFNGGIDREADDALMYRCQLAITGNNIGTKDGYLKYVLDYNNVAAAKVVGAGDNIMFRDGGYIDTYGEYHWGSGGCVDIYVKGLEIADSTYTFNTTANYLQSIPNIVLPNQPVKNILSITSELSGETFVNADIYDVEYYSYTNGKEVVYDVRYCIDMPWDFSVIDTFPDEEYYSLPIGYTSQQIERLKLSLDNELLVALNYMTNMSYTIDWSQANIRNTSEGGTALFDKIYVNDQVYKLRAKADSNLDNRIFVMKNNNIYVRAYVEPDFKLLKDISDYGGSLVGKDAIQWLNTRKLLANDVLTIVYNYDSLVNTIQANIEDQKCMTADVLIKQAIEVPIEISLDLSIYNTTSTTNVRNIISSDISTYIHGKFVLGGSFDASDIVSIVKRCEYVDSVDLSSVKLSKKGNAPTDQLTIDSNEYFSLSNLILNISVNS